MKEYLSHKGVEYKEFDVASDTQARNIMFQQSGKMAVPTILIGQEIIVGFDKNKIEQSLH